MTNKKFLTALAPYTISLELSIPTHLKEISRKLAKETEAFKERNSLAVIGTRVKDRKPIHQCCPNCLKAHLIKKAEEFGSDRALREILFAMVEYETGHYGYYTDGGNLKKI